MHSVSRIRFRQAKADFPLVLLAPHKSMAPVLAITDMVARARRDDSLSLTPMETFLSLIVTGPNRMEKLLAR